MLQDVTLDVTDVTDVTFGCYRMLQMLHLDVTDVTFGCYILILGLGWD
jgi:hypothetical protein